MYVNDFVKDAFIISKEEAETFKKMGFVYGQKLAKDHGIDNIVSAQLLHIDGSVNFYRLVVEY